MKRQATTFVNITPDAMAYNVIGNNGGFGGSMEMGATVTWPNRDREREELRLNDIGTHGQSSGGGPSSYGGGPSTGGSRGGGTGGQTNTQTRPQPVSWTVDVGPGGGIPVGGGGTSSSRPATRESGRERDRERDSRDYKDYPDRDRESKGYGPPSGPPTRERERERYAEEKTPSVTSSSREGRPTVPSANMSVASSSAVPPLSLGPSSIAPSSLGGIGPSSVMSVPASTASSARGNGPSSITPSSIGPSSMAPSSLGGIGPSSVAQGVPSGQSIQSASLHSVPSSSHHSQQSSQLPPQSLSSQPSTARDKERVPQSAAPSIAPSQQSGRERERLEKRLQFQKLLLQQMTSPMRSVSLLGSSEASQTSSTSDMYLAIGGTNAKSIQILKVNRQSLLREREREGVDTLYNCTKDVSVAITLDNVHTGSVYSSDWHIGTQTLASGSNDKSIRICK